MRHVLPSLNALRAVEAVGRLGSISAAANELAVTPGAISRQVALLEAHFRCTFFARTRHGMEPSEKGRLFLASIGEAFDLIHDVSEELQGRSGRRRLSVRACATFATEWLTARIDSFCEEHEDIEVQLTGCAKPVDFERDDADIGVMIGEGDWPELAAEPLYAPRLFPVCSPAYLAHHAPIKSARDMASHTLLHSSAFSDGWRNWFKAAGLKDMDTSCGHWFESSSQTLRAARSGAGLALGQDVAIANDLASGQLIIASGISIDWGRIKYYIVRPKRKAATPAMRSFADWVHEQIRETYAMMEDYISASPDSSSEYVATKPSMMVASSSGL